MDRANIEKIAQTEEDKILLARLWDKISAGIRKNIPVSTASRYMGHSDSTTLKIYSHFIPDTVSNAMVALGELTAG